MSREVQVRFCERVGVNYFSLLLYSTKSQSFLDHMRVRVRAGKVPIPSRFALRENLAPENGQFVLFPGKGRQQRRQKLGCLLLRKNDAMVHDDTVTWQAVGDFIFG